MLTKISEVMRTNGGAGKLYALAGFFAGVYATAGVILLIRYLVS